MLYNEDIVIIKMIAIVKMKESMMKCKNDNNRSQVAIINNYYR
jgi:hypothetical protein